MTDSWMHSLANTWNYFPVDVVGGGGTHREQNNQIVRAHAHEMPHTIDIPSILKPGQHNRPLVCHVNTLASHSPNHFSLLGHRISLKGQHKEQTIGYFIM